MKWFRRKPRRAFGIYSYSTDGSTPLATIAPPAPPIPEDVREDIDKALAEFPLAKVREARFFGVPMDMFSKEQLIQIVSWVGMNARDHRRDN